MRRTATILGYPIDCEWEVLDGGVSVLLTGGARRHVGAVSLALPGEKAARTLTYGDHRDGDVSGPWAQAIAVVYGLPVSVTCGIHYDNVTRAELKTIVDACGALLEAVLAYQKASF